MTIPTTIDEPTPLAEDFGKTFGYQVKEGTHLPGGVYLELTAAAIGCNWLDSVTMFEGFDDDTWVVTITVENIDELVEIVHAAREALKTHADPNNPGDRTLEGLVPMIESPVWAMCSPAEPSPADPESGKDK